MKTEAKLCRVMIIYLENSRESMDKPLKLLRVQQVGQMQDQHQ